MTVGQIWQKTKELPSKGKDFAQNNPWKTGIAVGVFVLASALAVYYYKRPDSQYAGFVNNVVAGIATATGKAVEAVKANPTIILTICLAVAIATIGVLAYKNHSQSSAIKEELKKADPDQVKAPNSALNKIAEIVGFKPQEQTV